MPSADKDIQLAFLSLRQKSVNKLSRQSEIKDEKLLSSKVFILKHLIIAQMFQYSL